MSTFLTEEKKISEKKLIIKFKKKSDSNTYKKSWDISNPMGFMF